MVFRTGPGPTPGGSKAMPSRCHIPSKLGISRISYHPANGPVCAFAMAKSAISPRQTRPVTRDMALMPHMQRPILPLMFRSPFPLLYNRQRKIILRVYSLVYRAASMGACRSGEGVRTKILGSHRLYVQMLVSAVSLEAIFNWAALLGRSSQRIC